MGTKAHTNKGMILVLACAAQFMVVLDVAVVNVALPSIQRDLDIGKGTLQWIIIAYGLMLGGFLLLGGRLADLLGRRRMLMTGLTLFSSASLLAGLAESAGLLIGARALQGFGAALIPPAALSILAVTFAEGAERNRALGLYGAVTGASASVGVLASGLLTEGVGWHWIFRINVPIGVLLIAMAAVFLPAERRPAVAGANASTSPARSPSPAACSCSSTRSTTAPTTAGVPGRRSGCSPRPSCCLPPSCGSKGGPGRRWCPARRCATARWWRRTCRRSSRSERSSPSSSSVRC